MEDQLYRCPNKRCPRWNVLVTVTTGPKRCSSCDAKLKQPKYGPNSDDAPPMTLDVGKSWDNWLDWRRKVYGDGDTRYRDYMERNRSHFPMLPSREQAAAPKNDSWTCNPDVEGCPVKKKAKVNVPVEMWDQWIFLARQLDTEWIAYLKGTGDPTTGEYNITEFYFPAQHVAPATVEPVDGERQQEGTIGSVHSHVSMGAKFSGTDLAHFNHDVELVINRNGDVDNRLRVKLDCGKYERTIGDVMLTQCDSRLAMVEQLKGKFVARPVWQPPAPQQTSQQPSPTGMCSCGHDGGEHKGVNQACFHIDKADANNAGGYCKCNSFKAAKEAGKQENKAGNAGNGTVEEAPEFGWWNGGNWVS